MHSCDGEALLLLRSSKHNDNTLGLPGGNLDAGENLTQASEREAREEVWHKFNVAAAFIYACVMYVRMMHTHLFSSIYRMYVSACQRQSCGCWRVLQQASQAGGTTVEAIYHTCDVSV